MSFCEGGGGEKKGLGASVHRKYTDGVGLSLGTGRQSALRGKGRTGEKNDKGELEGEAVLGVVGLESGGVEGERRE